MKGMQWCVCVCTCVLGKWVQCGYIYIIMCMIRELANFTLTLFLEVVNPDTQCHDYQYRYNHCHHNNHRKSH